MEGRQAEHRRLKLQPKEQQKNCQIVFSELELWDLQYGVPTRASQVVAQTPQGVAVLTMRYVQSPILVKQLG